MDGLITYAEIERFWGKASATQLLKCLERMSSIKNDLIYFDKNVRWDVALKSLNDIGPVN